MYDGIKVSIRDEALVEKLRNNDLLKFNQHCYIPTAEVTSYTSKYGGLNFELFSSSRVTINGSLHKYYNNGNNHDDFSMQKLKYTLMRLSDEFGVDPNTARLNNLEFGVNINTSFSPNAFLNDLQSYKWQPFNMMSVKGKGYGKECFHFRQYGLKIYNKGLQYGLPKNTLRIEKKIITMCALKRGHLYLSDLTNPELWTHCKDELIELLDHTIINEPVNSKEFTKNEQRIYNAVINQSNWVNFTRDKKARYKKSFNQIISDYGTQNYRASILDLVTTKCDELLV
ncbi:hypothetical protein ABDJ41_00100 [Pedobacter sp. ASV1-7]